MIEWTFDPLELANAYLNISRLGAIARRFEPNLYGLSSSPLHAGLPTDRLVAEWWLSLGRVKAATCGDPIAIAADFVRISVPLEIQELKKSGSAKALETQDTVRRNFSDLFKRGYGVSGFAFETGAGVYIFEKQEITRLPRYIR